MADVGELVVVDRQGTDGQVSLRAADDVVDVPVVPVELVESNEVLPGGRVPACSGLKPTDRGRLLGVGALSGPGGRPGDEGARAAGPGDRGLALAPPLKDEPLAGPAREVLDRRVASAHLARVDQQRQRGGLKDLLDLEGDGRRGRRVGQDGTLGESRGRRGDLTRRDDALKGLQAGLVAARHAVHPEQGPHCVRGGAPVPRVLVRPADQVHVLGHRELDQRGRHDADGERGEVPQQRVRVVDRDACLRLKRVEQGGSCWEAVVA